MADDRAVTRRGPAELGPPVDYEERERLIALMSGVERKGNWEPPARLSVLAIWGGAKLDFREADLLEGETVVDILAIMGGVEVWVPKDIDVEVAGTAIMGGFTHLSQVASEAPEDADAPLLRITGIAVMGGVEVKVKK